MNIKGFTKKMPGKKGEQLGYDETNDRLSIRITANKTFSTCNLEDWLRKGLPFSKGEHVLDIGCGNGNLFPCYAEKLSGEGVIVGIDKSDKLLAAAHKHPADVPTVLLRCNMNESLPFVDAAFHHAISTFAIYYVENVEAIANEIARVLKPEGKVLLIGPSRNNAKELYDFNRTIFSVSMSDETKKRTDRLESEFYPIFGKIFRDVTIEKIPAILRFPDREWFMRYYTATLLFEESVAATGIQPSPEELALIDLPGLDISKEMVVLRGWKNG